LLLFPPHSLHTPTRTVSQSLHGLVRAEIAMRQAQLASLRQREGAMLAARDNVVALLSSRPLPALAARAVVEATARPRHLGAGGVAAEGTLPTLHALLKGACPRAGAALRRCDGVQGGRVGGGVWPARPRCPDVLRGCVAPHRAVPGCSLLAVFPAHARCLSITSLCPRCPALIHALDAYGLARSAALPGSPAAAPPLMHLLLQLGAACGTSSIVTAGAELEQVGGPSLLSHFEEEGGLCCRSATRPQNYSTLLRTKREKKHTHI
jgi:hypothetical protein